MARRPWIEQPHCSSRPRGHTPPFYRIGIVQRSATRTAPLACSAADLPRPVPGTSACWCARRPRYIPRHARSPPRAHRPGIDLCRDGAARRGSTVGRSGLRPEVRINAGGLPQGGTRDRGVGREGTAHRGTDRTPFRFMNTRTRTLGQGGRGAGHDGAPPASQPSALWKLITVSERRPREFGNSGFLLAPKGTRSPAAGRPLSALPPG